jgi:hypothetical protein
MRAVSHKRARAPKTRTYAWHGYIADLVAFCAEYGTPHSARQYHLCNEKEMRVNCARLTHKNLGRRRHRPNTGSKVEPLGRLHGEAVLTQLFATSSSFIYFPFGEPANILVPAVAHAGAR